MSRVPATPVEDVDPGVYLPGERERQIERADAMRMAKAAKRAALENAKANLRVAWRNLIAATTLPRIARPQARTGRYLG